MKKFPKIALIFLILSFINFFALSGLILAQETKHIVISEIQVSGLSVYDEFIELYNPLDIPVNLDGWSLKKKTKSGSESNISSGISGAIQARGYFLIIPRANCGISQTEECYKGSASGDDRYTTNNYLAKDNAILLYDQSGELVGKVGWGEASDFEGEAVNFNPQDGESAERKKTNCAAQSTGNNRIDFALQTNPNPQNSRAENCLSDVQGESGGSGSLNAENAGSGAGTERTESSNQISGSGSDYKIKFPNLPQVIITEFLPNPAGDDEDNEFIEIYNNSAAEINLGGWSLEDKAGKTRKFVISSLPVKAGEYKTFYSGETGITLNNSGEGTILRDNKNVIIFETSSGDEAKEGQSYALDANGLWAWTIKPTPQKENIIEKKESASQNKSSAASDDMNSGNDSEREAADGGKDQSEGEQFSKDDQSPLGTGYDFSDKVIISEIFPNPKGRDNRDENYEWIELRNLSNRDVNLKGWKLDDVLEKGSKPYIIKEDRIIKAGGYLVFDSSETKLFLNNTKDEANVLWPDSSVVDKVKFKNPAEGFSYNLSSDDLWIWSKTISPGKANKISSMSLGAKADGNREIGAYDENEGGAENQSEEFALKDYPESEYTETEVEDAKNSPRYAKVKVRGIVSTPPGVFSNRIFYLYGSGIQVYGYGGKIPKLELGDEIELKGRISEIGGESRILLDKTEDITILGRGNSVEPKIVSAGSIDKKLEGSLVAVEGKVFGQDSGSGILYINDGSGRIKVYIKPETGIKKPELENGNFAVVSGQVSRTSLGYRILPRFNSDIKIAKVSGLSSKDSAPQAALIANESGKEENKLVMEKIPIYYYIALAALALIAILSGRRKLKVHKVQSP